MPLKGRTVACLWCLLIFGVYGEFLSSEDIRSCDMATVLFNQCHNNETCFRVDMKSSCCRCKKNYERKADGSCQPVFEQSIVKPSSDDVRHSDSGGFGFKLLFWLVAPVLLAGVIGVVVYTGRQKMWLNRLYGMRVRSYNNVLVSSQEEDDPPIA